MNPVVPGAAMPPMRFRAVEPLRRCLCGAPARCASVTRRRVSFFPVGTTYDYGCTVCSKTFVMESPWRVLVLAAGCALLTVLGLLTVMAGIGILFLLLALIGWPMTFWDAAKYLVHRVVREA